MVWSEFRGPVGDDVGGQVVGVVAPVALVGVGVFVVVLGAGGAQVTGLHRGKAQLGRADRLERHVAGDLEDVLDGGQFEGRRGDRVELVVLLVGLVVVPGGVAGRGAREGRRPVLVQRDEDRLRADLELALDDVRAAHDGRLVIQSLEDVCVLGDLEPGRHLDGTLGAEAQGVELFVAEVVDAVLVVVTAADAERGLLTRAGHIETIVLRGVVVFVIKVIPVGASVVAEGAVGFVAVRVLVVLVGRILPAAAEFLVVGRREGVVAVDRGRIGAVQAAALLGRTGGELGEEDVVLRPGRTVGDDLVLPDAGPAVDTVGGAEAGGNLVLGWFLGGHEDDAESTAGAVDGAGGGVLQDGDRLDVLGVDGGKVTLDAVDHHEAAAALAHGIGAELLAGGGGTGLVGFLVVAADADGALVGSLAVDGDDLKTGHLALEGAGDRRIGPVLEFLADNGFDGAHELGLLKSTVTDDDRGIEELRVVDERKVDNGATGNGFFDRLVPDALADEDSVGGCLDGIFAIEISDNSRRRPLDHDGRADQRFVVCVRNNAGNSHVLRQQRGGEKQPHHECSETGFE